MNPLFMVFLMLAAGAFAASAMNIPTTSALLFVGVGAMIWAAAGAFGRQYYQRRNHTDELSRQDIPMMLYWVTLGSIGMGLHDDPGHGPGASHGGDIGGGWSGDGGGSFSDGSSGGFGDGGGAGSSS